MDSKTRNMILGGVGGAVFLALVVTWRVSASHAEDAAAELVTASADMARCVAGDKIKITKADVLQGFERRMVAEMPDVSTVGNCDLALDVVKEKWKAYQSTWFNSTGASGKGGASLGKNFQQALDKLGAIPFKTPTNKVYHRTKKYGALLSTGKLAFAMYDAARALLDDEGASEEAIKTATSTHHRKTRRSPNAAPKGKVLFSLKGKLAPDMWNIVPMDPQHVSVTALTDKGQALIGWSNDSGGNWHHAQGNPGLAGKKNAALRVLHTPGGKRYFSLAAGQGKDTTLAVGKFPPADSNKFPPTTKVPGLPEDWKRPAGAEREVAVLADGTMVTPAWKIIEKTKEEKKAEKKAKKEREKNYADKAVQAALVLENERAKMHAAFGIDEDHKRQDGLAYAKAGGPVTVTPLEGYGLGAIVPGVQAQVLVGEGEIPSLRMSSAPIPKQGQPLGMLAEAGAMKPVTPALRGSPWYRCATTNGTTYGATERGTMIIGLHPGALELVPMTALADDGSHMGCGPRTTLVALPFAKDRIFANLLTVQAGEIEGGKITATAGTERHEYNQTVASAAVPKAIVVAWVARGYVLYVVSRNNGTNFLAPEFLAEAGQDGSKVRSVHLVDLGNRLIALTARERCDASGACTTTIEGLKSADDAKTWQPL